MQERLSESKADCLEIVLLREEVSQLKDGYLQLQDAQQVCPVQYLIYRPCMSYLNNLEKGPADRVGLRMS